MREIGEERWFKFEQRRGPASLIHREVEIRHKTSETDDTAVELRASLS